MIIRKPRTQKREPSGIWWPELVVVTVILVALLLVEAIGVPSPFIGDEVTSRERDSRTERDRTAR